MANGRVSRNSKMSKQLQKQKGEQQWETRIKNAMTSTVFTLIMTCCTLFSIFSMDIDKAFFTQHASFYFSSIHVVLMLFFSIQITLMSKTDKSYAYGFYFWIDIFSTLTMILQLIWIQNVMNSSDNMQFAVSFAKVSKVSRFSKIGARSTKIMKLIRLIKLIKLFKKKQQEEEVDLTKKQENEQNLQNQVQKQKQVDSISIFQLQKSNQSSISGQINNEQGANSLIGKIYRPNVNEDLQKQLQMKWDAQSEQLSQQRNPDSAQQIENTTKVGEVLKHQIQKNIVIMVMALIIMVPILSADTWYTKTADMQSFTDNYMQLFDDNETQAQTEWFQIFVMFGKNSSTPIVQFLDTQTNVSYIALDEHGYPQTVDLRQAQESALTTDVYTVIYSSRHENVITSYINIGRSIFITVLLVMASIFFIKDLENYALTPLQKMNKTVQKIQKNPFLVIDDRGAIKSEQVISEQIKQLQEQLQTNLLQKLLLKITSLLALGVGETPSRLTNSDQEHQKFIIQPKSDDENCVEVGGYFMVVQIAHLQKIIQCLGGESNQYISNVLQILHEVAVENGGFIFHQDQSYSMICWKVCSNQQNVVTMGNLHQKNQQKKKSELIFLALAKFNQRIEQDENMKKYEYLKQYINDYQFYKIHTGIHYGVSYCGPIGSSYKLSIRATGNDVSITKGLCKTAKRLKIDNLYSEAVYKVSAPCLKNVSRKIDDFCFYELEKCNNEPLQVYSAYLKLDIFSMEKSMCGSKIKQQQQQVVEKVGVDEEVQLRKKMHSLFAAREKVLINSKNKIEQIQNLSKTILKKCSTLEQWLEVWKDGQNLYEEGQWTTAKINFQNSKELCPLLKDFICDLRLKEITGREEPPKTWRKQKKFSLFQ